jgi:transcription elongation factor Elf1
MKCPVCGNEKKFMCEVVAVAEYDAETNLLYNLSDVDINEESGYIKCEQCYHYASANAFEDK